MPAPDWLDAVAERFSGPLGFFYGMGFLSCIFLVVCSLFYGFIFKGDGLSCMIFLFAFSIMAMVTLAD
jgi:hypothetical protein